MRAALVLVAIVVAGGCGRDPKDRVEPTRERPPRVIEPPVGVVRPLPPHLISAAGVGPYRLGDRFADVLQQLPSGPRVALFEIPNVLHRSLIRAEEGDSVRIGGEPNGTVTFVAVLDPQVAKTEAGVHVGSTRAELAKAGPLLEEPGRARDPDLVVLSNPRGARALFDRAKDRIAAIVVTADAPGVTPGANEPGCERPKPTDDAFGACIIGSGPGERVQIDGGEIAIRSAETDKPLGPPLRVSGNIVFAAPLRVEGRDELVIVTRSDEPQNRTWSLVAYRFEGTKLVKTADGPLYSLSATNARWIGVDLAEIDMYLELAAGADSIEVGGLLTTQADLPDAQSPWRDVVVISPVSVPRRHEKPTKPTAPSTEGSGSAATVDAMEETEPAKP